MRIVSRMLANRGPSTGSTRRILSASSAKRNVNGVTECCTAQLWMLCRWVCRWKSRSNCYRMTAMQIVSTSPSATNPSAFTAWCVIPDKSWSPGKWHFKFLKIPKTTCEITDLSFPMIWEAYGAAPRVLDIIFRLLLVMRCGNNFFAFMNRERPIF